MLSEPSPRSPGRSPIAAAVAGGTARRIGIGAMPLSTVGRPDRRTAFATLHAALDAGIRHIDTADAYGLDGREIGHNERLVAAAVATWSGPREDVVVATKGGHIRDAAGGWHTNGRPEWIRAAAHASRRRLAVERIGLYYFHRPDPAVDFMESVGALASLVEESVVDVVGLSNVDVAQLEAAATVIEVGAVQNELSPYCIDGLEVVEWCERAGVPFLAWGPLGGASRAGALGSDALTTAFADVARTREATAAQVSLAWLLSLSPTVWVIPGMRRAERVHSTLRAVDLALTADELFELDDAVARDDDVRQRLRHLRRARPGATSPPFRSSPV